MKVLRKRSQNRKRIRILTPKTAIPQPHFACVHSFIKYVCMCVYGVMLINLGQELGIHPIPSGSVNIGPLYKSLGKASKFKRNRFLSPKTAVPQPHFTCMHACTVSTPNVYMGVC